MKKQNVLQLVQKTVTSLCFCLVASLQLQAKDITIYFRDADNAPLSLYIWYYNADEQKKEPLGEWSESTPSDTKYQTLTLGGKVWKSYTVQSGEDNTTDTPINLIIRKHDDKGNIIVQTVDITNVSSDSYFVTSKNFMTKWSKEDGEKRVMLIHDITRSEAEGKTINYEVRMKAGNEEKKFFMSNVRNQEPAIHSTNTSLFTIGIADKDLPGNAGDKVEFYIAGSDDGQTYADGTTISNQFRPYEKEYDFTGKDYSYNNCQSTNDNFFELTKGSGVSYTICLNNSMYFGIGYGANEPKNSFNPNRPVGEDSHSKYGIRSIRVYTNQALEEDEKGYILIGNCFDKSDNTSLNQGANIDDDWNPSDANQQFDMSKTTKFDSTVGDPGDIVYECLINKLASKFNTIFYNICPRSVMEDTKKTWTNEDPLKDKWNYIIRPQVQAGKDAIALQGCVEITPTKVTDEETIMNRCQAFNANLDDNNYSQFKFYLNVTKSTYTIVPEESIDLIGNAVGIINRSTGEWQQGQWENGERQYHYVRMARNTKLDYKTDEGTDNVQTTKCWEYTGMFYQYDVEGGRGGKNAANGFRFLTNQTYVRNYIEDEHRPEHFTDEQKSSANYADKLAVNNPYWNEVQLDPYNSCSMNSPIKPYNPNGSPIYGALGNERDEGLHIGFVLPTAIYTMRFWQTTDKDGKIVKSWYTLGESITPPSPLPDNTDVYDNLNCIRTFSSKIAYKKPENMKVFIVDSYNKDEGQAHLKEIGYIPANTGVILAYNKDNAADIKKDADNLEFVSSDDKEDQKYIYEKFPSINFEETTENGDIGNNYLMPSVASQTIHTTEYKDNDESTKEVTYRNYMFTAYKKKGEDKYTLCFKRVITGTTSKNSAYLRLPADLCGGTKLTQNDKNIIGSSATFPAFSTSGAKEAFASISWEDSETTSINEVHSDIHSASASQGDIYFTLQGVQVSHPTASGIYIKNGKKVIIK